MPEAAGLNRITLELWPFMAASALAEEVTLGHQKRTDSLERFIGRPDR